LTNSVKYQLKERLDNRIEWLSYFESCLLHQEINEKVSREFYKGKSFLLFFVTFYFLPIKLINFVSKIRSLHYYLKCQKEIEVLKHEMEKIQNND